MRKRRRNPSPTYQKAERGATRLLEQSGKPKVNKISAATFDELVSRLEAVASDPEAVVRILET